MSPALFFREHSQEKPIFSFSSKPVPQQSPQPHKSTSGLPYLDPEPEVYTTLWVRRKVEHPFSHYPQQLLNPKSDPWPDFPSLIHSPPLQRGRQYRSLRSILPSPSSPKKPLSAFPQQSSQSITQQLPKSDPMSDFSEVHVHQGDNRDYIINLYGVKDSRLSNFKCAMPSLSTAHRYSMCNMYICIVILCRPVFQKVTYI